MAKKKEIQIIVTPGNIALQMPRKQKTFLIGKDTYSCIKKAMRESTKMKKGVKLVKCRVKLAS